MWPGKSSEKLEISDRMTIASEVSCAPQSVLLSVRQNHRLLIAPCVFGILEFARETGLVSDYIEYIEMLLLTSSTVSLTT